jgi:hypothetical protein
MTFAHVQGTAHSGQSGTSINATFSSAVTSGNVVTGVIGWVGYIGGTDSLTSVTDDQGNAYTVIGKVVNFLSGTTYYWATFFSAAEITNAPTIVTATLTPGSGSPVFAVAMIDEWSGFSGTYGKVGSGTATSSGAATLSVSIASRAAALRIGYCVDTSSTSVTAGSGFTSVQYVINTWMAEWAAGTGLVDTVSATVGSVSGSGGSLFGFTLGIPPVPPPSNTTFYVSPTGNDTNNGTSPSTPWQTIAFVNAQTYSLGNQILFEGGQTFSGNLSFIPANYDSGNPPTAGSPLIIDSYSTGQATLAPIAMQDIGDWTIQNLIITGSNTTGENGIYALFSGFAPTLGDIIVSGLTITNCGESGILFKAPSDGVLVSTVLISNNTISNCTAAPLPSFTANNGIYFTGALNSTQDFSGVTITGCNVNNCPGVAGGTSGYFSGGGILLVQCEDSVVENCLIHDCGLLCDNPSGPSGIQYGWCNNSVVKFCEVYNQKTANSDGAGIDLDGGCIGCTIEYCYVHDNQGEGLSLFAFGSGTADNTNCTVRYNLAENNGYGGNKYAGIWVWATAGNVVTGGQIYNNTIYADLQPCLQAAINTSISVFNNIFYTTSNAGAISGSCLDIVAPGGGTTQVIDGNCYYAPNSSSPWSWNGTNYGTLAAYQAASSQDAHAIATNPALQNAGGGGTIGGYAPPAPTAYHLLSGSPAIGTGLNINSLYSINPGTQDYYGNAIPNGGSGSGFNMGAFGSFPSGEDGGGIFLFGGMIAFGSAAKMAKAIEKNPIETRRRIWREVFR